jgi:hypothetical protein
MHDVTSSHWHEPEGTKNAGYGAWKRPNTAYEKAIDEGAIDIRDGGTAIPYWDEDPFIRQEYEQILKAGGVPSQIDASLYVDPLKT